MSQELEKLLLSLGGTRVVWQENPFGAALPSSKAFIFNPKEIGARLEKMWPCHCHDNAPMLAYEAAKDGIRAEVWTGYALSDDGLWRCHSWCVLPGEKKPIYETTEKRKCYYGVKISKQNWKGYTKKTDVENYYAAWGAHIDINSLI